MPKEPEKSKTPERRFPATPIYDSLVAELGAPWPAMAPKGKHSGGETSYTD
jgi:hypothetical protein